MLLSLGVLFGLIGGSLVTRLVMRVPSAAPLAGPNRCYLPSCGRELSRVEALPFLGWLWTRGRCQQCGTLVPRWYVLAEVTTILSFTAVAIRYDSFGWLVVVPWLLVTPLVALAFIDLQTYRLPNRLVFASLAMSLVSMVAMVAFGHAEPDALIDAMAASLGYFGFLLILHLISPRGMGFGDVKLALVLGLHAGWVAGVLFEGWVPVARLTFWAVFLGVLSGTLMGLGVAAFRSYVRTDALADPDSDGGAELNLLKAAFPFGPGLILGTVIVLLFPHWTVG